MAKYLEEVSMQNPVGALVRRQEQQYVSGTTTTISKYVQFDLYENINKIDAYINSKHVSGDKDSMGRDKPFFNIVTAAINIWYRATDIDRKNIRIKADSSKGVIPAFLASIVLQEWMKRENFGVFLNEWGRTLARYGSSVVKFVEKNGELYSSVIPWNRLIVDAIDIESGPIIEVLELTEAQLRQREGYDQDMVDNLCNALNARQLMDKTRKDNKNDFIRLYEVHGQFPVSWLTGKKKDEDTYAQQVHVVSFVQGNGKGKWNDYTLYSGRETNPYMITHLIKEDGRTMGIGAVEHLFDAQWMVNHSVFSIKNQLDLASKLIFQTSDGNYVGRNALTAIETGDILVTKINEPLTQVNNNSHDITSLQSFGAQWKAIAQEITNTPDALLGQNAPSGTAWRQVEAVQAEAHSLFELMTENKGLAIEDMMRRFVIPFLKKKLNNADEIAATLEAHDITKIDSLYIPIEATRRYNSKLIDSVLNGGQMPDLQQETAGVQKEMSQLGNQRFFKPSEISLKTWAEMFKDLEWTCEVDVTGEAADTQNVITTLTTVLQSIATNPAILNDPNAKLVFNKILEQTNAISPLELAFNPSPVAPPAGGGVAALGGALSAVAK